MVIILHTRHEGRRGGGTVYSIHACSDKSGVTGRQLSRNISQFVSRWERNYSNYHRREHVQSFADTSHRLSFVFSLFPFIPLSPPPPPGHPFHGDMIDGNRFVEQLVHPVMEGNLTDLKMF